MFQFPAFASYTLFYSGADTLLTMLGNLFSSVLTAKGLRTARCKSTDGLAPCMGIPKQAIQPTKQISQAFKVGSPIRISMDQSSFAAPHGFSQRITSFFACACQGIHQLPLRHLIVLIANAHPYLDLEFLSSSLALRGVPNLAIRANLSLPRRLPKARLPFTTRPIRCHRRVRSGHFIGATPSSSLVPDL